MERVQLSQRWPEPPLNIVLVEPEIPPNTGAIARLCAATGSRLHLVDPLGFRLTDPKMKRAGLDYWPAVDMQRHSSLDSFMLDSTSDRRVFYSTRGTHSYTAAQYRPGDYLVFGSETRGLPQEIVDSEKDRTYGIPMRNDNVRSLNLATSVAIVLYEALRQIDLLYDI